MRTLVVYTCAPMDARVAPFVEAARGYVRRAISLELDLGSDSLAYVDHYIGTLRTDAVRKLEPDVLRLTASALGAYFGEVLIEAFGGGWVIPQSAEQTPELWQLELDPPSVSLHPVALAACALAGETVDGYEDRITPSLGDAAALQALLENKEPVEAAYFFSLTGRFELLEQTRELLAEIDRRRQAGPPPDAPDDDDVN